MAGKDEDKLPLHDEAEARAKWRGADDAAGDGDGSKASGGEAEDGRPGKGRAGNFPPPD